jgi:Lrp/AsnC family transcriptional regulator
MTFGIGRSTLSAPPSELILGRRTLDHSPVRTTEHSDKWLQEFAAAVNEIKEVVESWCMSGDGNCLSNLRIGDVSSAFAMEEMRYTTCIPLPTI